MKNTPAPVSTDRRNAQLHPNFAWLNRLCCAPTPAKENPDRPARFCSDKCRARSWRQRRDNESSRFAAIESRLSALEAAVGKIGTGGTK